MKTVFLILLFFSFSMDVFSQMSFRLKSDSCIVGQPVLATFELSLHGNAKLSTEPHFSKPLPQQLGLLHQTELKRDEKTNLFSQSFYITGYDSGRFAIPPIKVNIDSAGKQMQLLSDSLIIKVNTLPVDTAKYMEIKDIYDVDIPFMQSSQRWWWISGGIILLLAFFAFWYFRRKKKLSESEAVINRVPPFDEAMISLGRISEQKTWLKDQGKEFYISITDVIRRYLWRQFDINAQEMTSSELLPLISDRFHTDEVIRKTNSIFKTADLAKFAKYKALPGECEIHLNEARQLIELIKPNDVITEPENQVKESHESE